MSVLFGYDIVYAVAKGCSSAPSAGHLVRFRLQNFLRNRSSAATAGRKHSASGSIQSPRLMYVREKLSASVRASPRFGERAVLDGEEAFHIYLVD